MAGGVAGGRSIGGPTSCTVMWIFVERLVLLSGRGMVVSFVWRRVFFGLGFVGIGRFVGIVFVDIVFVIFGKVIVPEIAIVSGLANICGRFGLGACVIFGLGAGTCTQMEVFLVT